MLRSSPPLVPNNASACSHPTSSKLVCSKFNITNMTPTPKRKLSLPPSNSSILQCPSCQKSIIGHTRVRRHPFAEKLKDSATTITGIWTALLVLIFIASFSFGNGLLIGRGLGWYLLAPLLPEFSIALITRLCPQYRITDCPYCDHLETRYLGL